MSNSISSVFERIRQPEYTGENRCTPCSLINVVIAVFATALVSFVAVELGVFVALISALLIYLRGYLVPGTPELTQQYLPKRILVYFDKHPTETTREETQTFETVEKIKRQRQNSVDPEQFLVEIGVTEAYDDEDSLYVTDQFSGVVEQRTERFREGTTEQKMMATLLDTEPDEVTLKDRKYPAISIKRRIRKWPSKAALVADAATNEALNEQSNRWDSVPLEQRLSILETLRSFHETCPLCTGEVEYSTDTVESCCRAYKVIAFRCIDCEKPLVEYDPEAIDANTTDKGIRP